MLHSRWLTMGAVTQAFEAEFAAAAGAKHALAVSNATEALHLACLAVGIGPGDEVITPVADLCGHLQRRAVLRGRGALRGYPSEPEDLTIDPSEIERRSPRAPRPSS